MNSATDWKKHQLPELPWKALVPCNGHKRPIDNEWEHLECDWRDIAELNGTCRAVGINTGKCNLICIDIDGEIAAELISSLDEPITWTIWRERGPGRKKIVFTATPEQKSQLTEACNGSGKWKRPSCKQLEVFWHSQQFIVAGDHPDGDQYLWHETPDTIAPLPDEWLKFILAEMAGPKQQLKLQDLLTKDHSQLVESGLGSEGGRNDALFALAADAISAEREALLRGWKTDITAKGLLDGVVGKTDWPDKKPNEVENAIASADCRSLTAGFEKRWLWATGQKSKLLSLPALPGPMAGVAEEFGSGWNEEGKKSSLDVGSCSAQLMKLGTRLRYNLLGYEVELDGKTLPDIERHSLLAAIQNQGWRVGDDDLMKALGVAAFPNAYHPVQEYLQRIDADPSIPLIDLNGLATMFLRPTAAKRESIYDQMLSRGLIGAVARAMNRGCKMDYVVILQGDQGCKKSEFWSVLFGPWFSVFQDDLGNKDSYLALHAAWGIEMAEFERITTQKQSGKLKAFCTIQSDVLRLPYGRKHERCDRPSVIVGSVNTDDFLRDETGNRRYWIIPVTATERMPIEIGLLASMRDSIWKSAYQAWKQGELPMLSVEESAEVTEKNKDFEVESILCEPLKNWLRAEGGVWHHKHVVKQQMLKEGLVPDWLLDRQIKGVLDALGWKTYKPKGKSAVWCLDTEEARQVVRDSLR